MHKIIASGDHHFAEGARFEECVRVHTWIAELVEEERPDAFLSAGDLYDRASTPVEREAVADWLTRIAEVCPVVIVRGNHDKHRDLVLLGRLRTRHPVIVEEGAAVHVVGGVAVACMAWPNTAWLARQTGQAGEARDQTARALMGDVLRGLRRGIETRGTGPSVLLTHAMIDGSETSTGQPLIGAELNVGREELGLAGADITIAGHIHKPQEWEWNGSPIVYTGSPVRTAFGEVEEKSVTVVEWGPGGQLLWRREATPARPMVQLDGRWRDGQLLGLEHPSLLGAEVRARYAVPADERDAARAAALAWRDRITEAGAHSVKLEERVVATSTARLPEVATATTLADKLGLLWDSRGTVPETERRARLLGMTTQLQSEAMQ